MKTFLIILGIFLGLIALGIIFSVILGGYITDITPYYDDDELDIFI